MTNVKAVDHYATNPTHVTNCSGSSSDSSFVINSSLVIRISSFLFVSIRVIRG